MMGLVGPYTQHLTGSIGYYESKTPGSAGEISDGCIRLYLADVQSAIFIAFIDCQPLRGANNRNTSGFAGGFLYHVQMDVNIKDRAKEYKRN